MRLTLRTLLAYRDNVLSPADREDLHRRIQSSQYGGNLLRGIGEITQGKSVGTPPVLGKGLGADANSIAEYLDDALPHSQVPELERVCLDSAVHLAELADCHSLLSSAARTKVSVSPTLRQMALGLGEASQRGKIEEGLLARKQSRRRGKSSSLAAAASAGVGVTAAPASDDTVTADLPVHVEVPMLASGGESIRPQGLNLETSVLTHEVPEYLIGSSTGHWKFPLAIAGLLTLLIFLVWQSLGPLENVRELFAQVPSQAVPSEAVSSQADASRVNANQNSTSPVDLDTIIEAEQVPPGIAPAEGLPPQTAIEIVADDAAPPGATPSTQGNPDLAHQLNVETEAAAPPGLESSEAPPKPAVAAPPQPTASDPFDSSSAAPPGLAEAPNAEGPNPAVKAAEVTAELQAFSDQETPQAAAISSSPAGSHAVWSPSEGAASEAVILWRNDADWKRLDTNTPLSLGSQWVIPPATRTTIALPGGVQWTACGPSQLELADVAVVQTAPVTPPELDSTESEPAPDSATELGISTQLCRALVRGKPDGSALRLATPLGKFQIEWLNPNSLVSIEVGYRPLTLGSIVDQQATKPVLIIVAADESVSVKQLGTSAAPYQLSLGDGLACVGDGKPITFRLQNIPSWYRSSADRPIDKMAATDLHRFTLTADAGETVEPAGVIPQLVELSHSRRPETAALAVQTALLCGDWKPLAAGFLDDARMRSHWMPTIHLTQQVLAANPAAEPEARAVFNEVYGATGAELFDLLSGLPLKQLDPAALSPIVQRLESPQMAFRVVALYQLQALTGKSLGVQPAAVSRTAIQQWRREVATNRELILPLGDPIWERVPK